MNYTKCLVCESEWKSRIIVSSCPFCHAPLTTEPTFFSKMEDAVAFIINKYGRNIVNEPKKFMALMCDYIQMSIEDKYALEFIIKNDVYTILESVDHSIADSALEAKAKALHKLSVLNPALAEKAVFWFTNALGWSNTITLPEEKPVASKEIPAPSPNLPPVKINVGDVVTYGSYLYTARKAEKNIEWKVIHAEKDKVLLLSTKCLDVQPFNKNIFFANSWEKSTLRKWLNSTFKDAAFDPDDQKYIIKTASKPSYNPRSGKSNGYSDVIDEIFILSHEDIEKYALSTKELATPPTLYTISQKIYNSRVDNTAYWWIRSPGNDTKDSMIVSPKGRLDEVGIDVTSVHCGVRPAIWVSTEAFR